ncbi:MAG: hypothetical protein IRZ32_04480 [Solirubrobacteraceae bacterium]|nr:hypothetical protein [Solirubrobacteraceae bacterium]
MVARALNRMPPLAAVTVLFVGLTLPQALLGLPIAAAAIGPLPALGILVGMGAVMTIAAAAEAEAIARDRGLRTGGFFGRLVRDYLGARGGTVPDVLAGVRTSLSVIGAYVGLCLTLAALTGLPRVLWGGLAAGALAVLLLRGGLRISAWVGALLGIACLPLLAAIAVVAILVPGSGDLGRVDLSAAGVGEVLGLSVMLYIANVYVLEIAREDLGVDPDGRALVRGSALGTIVLTAIAAGWLLAASAAVHPSALHGEDGTVLGPLADRAGTVVAVLGTVATILLLGLGIERTAVAIMRLVAERVPGRAAAIGAPLALCAIGELLMAADLVSFSGVFRLAGVATNVVLALALPMLLLAAARRLGGVEPGAEVPVFGTPAGVATLVALAFALLAGFATVLAPDAATRGAGIVGLVALAAVLAVRRVRAAVAARP